MSKLCSAPVMIIDDNEIDIFINKKVIEFSELTSTILCMNSATEALAYMEQGDLLPELIFLDLNMPVVDGYQFLYEYSKLPEDVKSNIRIVVLSSSDNARDREKVAANEDVMQFMSKPLTETKLNKLKEDMLAGRAEKV